MKRKVLWVVTIGALAFVLIMGITQYIEARNRQTDPNWQIANEIYKVENALKEVDEGYECQSISKVTPFTYTDSDGNTIVYYCCQTAYIPNESGKYAGLCLSIRNCIKRAPKSTVLGQHRFGFEKPCFCCL